MKSFTATEIKKKKHYADITSVYLLFGAGVVVADKKNENCEYSIRYLAMHVSYYTNRYVDNATMRNE